MYHLLFYLYFKGYVFMSATETHNLKNINKTIDETLPIMKQVIQDAKAANKKVTAYVSTVFDCPFEGKTDVNQVLRIAEALFEYGADDIRSEERRVGSVS